MLLRSLPGFGGFFHPLFLFSLLFLLLNASFFRSLGVLLLLLFGIFSFKLLPDLRLEFVLLGLLLLLLFGLEVVILLLDQGVSLLLDLFRPCRLVDDRLPLLGLSSGLLCRQVDVGRVVHEVDFLVQSLRGLDLELALLGHFLVQLTGFLLTDADVSLMVLLERLLGLVELIPVILELLARLIKLFAHLLLRLHQLVMPLLDLFSLL